MSEMLKFTQINWLKKGQRPGTHSDNIGSHHSLGRMGLGFDSYFLIKKKNIYIEKDRGDIKYYSDC